jgi:hypothetical protein
VIEFGSGGASGIFGKIVIIHHNGGKVNFSRNSSDYKNGMTNVQSNSSVTGGLTVQSDVYDENQEYSIALVISQISIYERYCLRG